MEAISEVVVDLILAQLEHSMVKLEKELTLKQFYLFVSLTQYLEGTKKTPLNLNQIGRLAVMAEKLIVIKSNLYDYGARVGFYKALKVLASETTYLSRFYGGVRPQLTQFRQQLHKEFREFFNQQTGKNYQVFNTNWNAQESNTIITFWQDTFQQAVLHFQSSGDLADLDYLIACLPYWAEHSYDRWFNVQGQRSAAKQLMEMLEQYLLVGEKCMLQVRQLAADALAQSPVADRVSITKQIEQKHAASITELRSKINAIQITKEITKEQKKELQKEKSQLNEALGELIKACDTEITSTLKAAESYRKKLSDLDKRTYSYRDNIMQRITKEIFQIITRIIWTYDLEKMKDEQWLLAKKEAKSIFRNLLKT